MMVAYFLLSIVNSMAQNYHKRLSERTKNEGKRKKNEGKRKSNVD